MKYKEAKILISITQLDSENSYKFQITYMLDNETEITETKIIKNDSSDLRDLTNEELNEIMLELEKEHPK